MGRLETELERAFERWSEASGQAAQVTRERRCVHYAEGAAGDSYAGSQYVAALQKMRGSHALSLARRVEPFFWEDARLVRVWLCRRCSEEFGLRAPEDS